MVSARSSLLQRSFLTSPCTLRDLFRDPAAFWLRNKVWLCANIATLFEAGGSLAVQGCTSDE